MKRKPAIKRIVHHHIKRHAHGYGIIAAVLSLRIVPMVFDIAALLVANILSRRWLGGGV